MRAVLKWFLASLRAQQYGGRAPADGVKKPLNAFLGEVFTGSAGTSSDDDDDGTHLVSEQVSHHPPVTACRLWNARAGVRAEGYTRQEISFTGAVHVRQTGHALLHLDRFDEDYLIPLPDVTVKGVLSAGPYPELTEPCTLVSSAGLLAVVEFAGKGILGTGRKNRVSAGVYRWEDRKRADALCSVDGCWSECLTFRDAAGAVIDTHDVMAVPPAAFHLAPVDRQDPWESHRAWGDVIAALHRGDMKGVSEHKARLETAQRQLRQRSDTADGSWRPLFFQQEWSDPRAEKLLQVIGGKLDAEKTKGVWKFAGGEARHQEKPWRGDLTPFGR